VLECTQPPDGICVALSFNFTPVKSHHAWDESCSWELIEKSVSILARNKSLMFLPVASAIASMAISVVMLSGGALLFRPEIQWQLADSRQYALQIHQHSTSSPPLANPGL
jgi:hypothetical protein